jgi:hypothetical protein
VTKLTNNTDANLKGTMSESNRCADCGFDTAPGLPNRAEVEQAATAQIAAGIKNWSIPCEVNDRSELESRWHGAVGRLSLRRLSRKAYRTSADTGRFR